MSKDKDTKFVTTETKRNYMVSKPKSYNRIFLSKLVTDSFIVYQKTEDISIDIAKDVETRFDTSKYELERPLPRGKI